MGRIIIIILLVCILIVNLTMGYFVLKHYEVFSNDPFVYGAKEHHSTCWCVNDKNQTYWFDENAIHYTIHRNSSIKQDYNINYSNFLEVLE